MLKFRMVCTCLGSQLSSEHLLTVLDLVEDTVQLVQYSTVQYSTVLDLVEDTVLAWP